MTNKWSDPKGRLQLYDHLNDCVVSADDKHKMYPFTLGYCSTLDHLPGMCFKDACELWDPSEKRCSLSDRIRR